ncbi:MAG: hypothetical protein MI923_10730 [Phycisphaerales bacterium]|nr:hypothetical protein [Phycisphaerales bacterium]
MLGELNEAIACLPHDGSLNARFGVETIMDLEEALDNLLDALEENVESLPKDPGLRTAIKEVCQVTGRHGALALMV